MTGFQRAAGSTGGYSGLTAIDKSGKAIPNGIPASSAAIPPPTTFPNSGILALNDLTPIAPVKSGGFSAAKINANGYALTDLTPAEQLLVQRIVANGDPKGDLTEMIVDSVAKRQGLSELVGGKYGSNNGYDHLFMDKNGGVTLLLESKQFASGATAVSPNAAGGLQQMSDPWVQRVLLKLNAHSPARIAVTDAINNGTLVKGILGVDRTTGKVMIIRVQ